MGKNHTIFCGAVSIHWYWTHPNCCKYLVQGRTEAKCTQLLAV